MKYSYLHTKFDTNQNTYRKRIENKKLTMKKKNTILILVTFLSLSLYGQKNSSDAGGPPKLSELLGVWKKVDLPDEDKINKENPWPQKYQWFAFYKNGKAYSMMSDSDYDYSEKDLKEIFKILPSDKTPDCKLDGQFLTIVNKEIKDYRELWGVNLFAKDINNFLKKGYLMMTLDDGNGSVIYYRLLKRIE